MPRARPRTTKGGKGPKRPSGMVAIQPAALTKLKLTPGILDELIPWQQVDEGGDNHEGKIKNLGQCECGLDYTVNTTQTPINAWPIAGMGAACLKDPPPVLPPEIPCKGKCKQVQQGKEWSGWRVLRNTKTGQLVFNCNTFAQFHCELEVEA